MRRRLLTAALVSAALPLFASVASAQVPVTGVSGTWNTVLGGTNVNGVGTSVLNFGVGVNQSGYTFAATAPATISPLVAGTQFDLGVFTHRNFPINSGTSITGATLNFQLVLDAAAVPSVFNQAFNFTHFETPNNATPCADGGTVGVGVNINGCADRVTFGFAGAANSFSYLGQNYFLELVGFRVASGATVNQFWTAENQANNATLVGRLTTRDPSVVPEPASLALLAIGGMGMLVARRRRTA